MPRSYHQQLSESPARWTTVDTPDGPFTLITNDDTVLAAGWTGDPHYLIALISPRLRPTEPIPGTATHPAADAVRDYYHGDHLAPGTIPVRQISGTFREHAWKVLRETPPGAAITYSEFARQTGRPAAIRAAAGACAHNAAALFVPCHRVLRSDGSLGGFRYGINVKECLLERERSKR